MLEAFAIRLQPKKRWSPVWLWLALLPLFVSLVSGCSSGIELTQANCPPPPVPVCKPGSFDKLLLDTLYHGPGTIQNRVTALPEGINSSFDDNAITFIPATQSSTSPNTLFAIISTDRLASPGTATREQAMYAAPFVNTVRYGELKPVETGSLHSAGAGFYSTADSRFYFSAKAENDDPDDYDLFSATVVVSSGNVSLEDIHQIAELNTLHHFESQPTLDATGLHIYFVSDRPGGMGGTDIWIADRSTIQSDWSMPRVLPPPVNTECDELSPFMHGTTLYFASNGHETVGGYDLFKASLVDGHFASADNLGRPYNTEYDEIFPAVLNDTAIFWSTNAPGYYDGRNLYTITRRHTPKSIAEEQKFQAQQERLKTEHLAIDTTSLVLETPPQTPLGPVDVYVHVTRGIAATPAAGADLFVRTDSTEIYRGLVPKSGNFLIKVDPGRQYDIGAETADAFFDVKHLDLRDNRNTSEEVTLNLPDTLVLRINFPFDDHEHPYEFVIDENGLASTMTWRTALDMTAHSAIRSLSKLRELIVIGHTDSLGTDAYNRQLGLERAQFIADELARRGVPKSLLHVRSMGRSIPVPRKEGESDDNFRLRSRRVEFIKLFK